MRERALRNAAVVLAFAPACALAHEYDENRILQQMLNFFAPVYGERTIRVDGAKGTQTRWLLERITERQAQKLGKRSERVRVAYERCAADAMKNAKGAALEHAIECLVATLARQLEDSARSEEKEQPRVTFVAGGGDEPISGRTIRVWDGTGWPTLQLDRNGRGRLPWQVAGEETLRITVESRTGREELAGTVEGIRMGGRIRLPVGAVRDAGTAITMRDLQTRLGVRMEVCDGHCRDAGDRTLGTVTEENARIVLGGETRQRAWTGMNAGVTFDELAAMYCEPDRAMGDVVTRSGRGGPSRAICADEHRRVDPPEFRTAPEIAIVLSVGAWWRAPGDEYAWMSHFARGAMRLVRGIARTLEGTTVLSYYLSDATGDPELEHIASIRLAQDEERHFDAIETVYERIAAIPAKSPSRNEIEAAVVGLGKRARGGPGMGAAILFTAAPEDGRRCPVSNAPAPLVVAWSASGGGVTCPRTVRYLPDGTAGEWMDAVANAVGRAVMQER